jgi:uncharacterized protein involved in oxidation of intracellular sulfur
MKVLLILNREPYDGTDVTWNALRLANKLLEKGAIVRIFLMNDAVDLARNETVKPEHYDQDLVSMLKELTAKGVPVKVCGSCMARCGIHKNKPYFAYEGRIFSAFKLAIILITFMYCKAFSYSNA